jgi:ubiquinone/menaquinone biosynthesis C-methylase UbiE
VTSMRQIVDQAAVSGGYDRARGLRQAHDQDWVLDEVPDAPVALADLGTGTGELLAAMVARFGATLAQVVGYDVDDERLRLARPLAETLDVRPEIVRADLRELPATDAVFDAVTITSVLHWLYPDEDRCLRWVGEHLRGGGVCILTTHHPETDEWGLGGSDHIAQEACALLGVPADEFRSRLEREGIVPIGRAVRREEDIEQLLARWVGPARGEDRRAEVRVAEGDDYRRFHAATFGTYYSRVLPPESQEDYFTAVGHVAEERMKRLGTVTSMSVRRWTATSPS